MPGIRTRTVTYRRMVDFSPTAENEQKATVGIVKSTLKIPSRHSGTIPNKIKGHMAYFTNNQDSKWEKI